MSALDSERRAHLYAIKLTGKDVSSLFTDVVKNMHTDNIELKKLVYLYIINYARSQPDKVPASKTSVYCILFHPFIQLV